MSFKPTNTLPEDGVGTSDGDLRTSLEDQSRGSGQGWSDTNVAGVNAAEQQEEPRDVSTMGAFMISTLLLSLCLFILLFVRKRRRVRVVEKVDMQIQNDKIHNEAFNDDSVGLNGHEKCTDLRSQADMRSHSDMLSQDGSYIHQSAASVGGTSMYSSVGGSLQLIATMDFDSESVCLGASIPASHRNKHDDSVNSKRKAPIDQSNNLNSGINHFVVKKTSVDAVEIINVDVSGYDTETAECNMEQEEDHADYAVDAVDYADSEVSFANNIFVINKNVMVPQSSNLDETLEGVMTPPATPEVSPVVTPVKTPLTSHGKRKIVVKDQPIFVGYGDSQDSINFCSHSDVTPTLKNYKKSNKNQ